MNDTLDELVQKAKSYTKYGKVATYIPELKHANPKDLSIAMISPQGVLFAAGDTHDKFTLQSISKILTLALVLIERGEDYVFERVGMEPTGDPFNSIAKLEEMKPAKPLNPMINAGALAITHMIKGATVEERLNKLLTFIRELADNPNITYNKDVAKSEYETAHLNRALCYYMKQYNNINEDIEELLDLYTKQCSIEVDVVDLSKIGLVFAMGGYHPLTNKRLIPKNIARLCNTFMVTCGMYNASGEFAIKVGIPAKSGVAGGIMGAVPHRYGIGVYGPALDEKGNSIAGLKLLEMLEENYELSIF